MTTLCELLEQRAEAASRLEAIINALGDHYQAYVEATARIEQHSGAALQTYLDVPLTVKLANAGLAHLLERKFSGVAPSLRVTVETQHHRVFGKVNG